MADDAEAPPAPAAGSRRHAITFAIVAFTIIAIGAVFTVRALARDWDSVSAALESARPGLLAAGLTLAFVSVWLQAAQWHAALGALGHHPPIAAATRWFMVGQLGKYVPGGVWHAVGVGELATRGGVPRRPAYGSAGLSTVSLVGGAALLVAVGGAISGGANDVRWWTVGAAVALCATLYVTPLRRFIFRVAGAAPEAAGSSRTISVLIGRSLPVWLCIGAGTWCITAALGSEAAVGFTLVAAVTSWLVGILALPAPGGIGVREAVLVLALRAEMGSGPATAAAVAARLAFVVADVSWLPLSRLIRVPELPAGSSSDGAPSTSTTG